MWVKRGLDSVATWLPMFAGVESWPSFYKVVGGGPCGGWLGGLGRRGELEEVKEGRASIGKRTCDTSTAPPFAPSENLEALTCPNPTRKGTELCAFSSSSNPLFSLYLAPPISRGTLSASLYLYADALEDDD